MAKGEETGLKCLLQLQEEQIPGVLHMWIY